MNNSLINHIMKIGYINLFTKEKEIVYVKIIERIETSILGNIMCTGYMGKDVLTMSDMLIPFAIDNIIHDFGNITIDEFIEKYPEYLI